MLAEINRTNTFKEDVALFHTYNIYEVTLFALLVELFMS